RWTKTVPIEGGKHYTFHAVRKIVGADGRRAAVARVIWLDAKGKGVMHDEPSHLSYKPDLPAHAEPEYPEDGATDARGWTEVAGTDRAPSPATQAVVELEFRWAPNAKLEWSHVTLPQVPAPAARKVRLAAVHYIPRQAKTPAARREAFAPLIADAAKQGADF